MNKTPSKPKTPVKKPREAQLKIDTSNWLTRYEASDLLRCSPQTLKNYQHRGMLHPKEALRRDTAGNERAMLVFNPKELADLPSRNPGGQPRIAVREPGELAARAFEMFREGRQLDEVVIELREDPGRIDQLFEHWLDHTKARYVITVEAKKRLEEILGPFNSVTDLVEIIVKMFGHMGGANYGGVS